MRTLYDILGVPHDATYQEIRDAYHSRLNALGRKPLADLEQGGRLEAATELKWVRRAWDVLASPENRKRYDQQLVELVLRAASTRARATPADSATQPAQASFCCHHCGYGADNRIRTECPRCGAPAKAVWLPESRIVWWLGLAPVLIRIANFTARQYRSLAGTLAALRASLLRTTHLIVVFILALAVLCVAVWRHYASEDAPFHTYPPQTEYLRPDRGVR